jgi:ATP-dependent protease HslVU (ClpYQ) peptidase subunit
MTTIAIDAHTIAADGLRTWGDDIVGRSERKIRIWGGRIYALTGMAPYFEALMTWHARGADPEKAIKCEAPNSWMLIVIERPREVIKYTNTCPYPEVFTPPIAFGAGLDLAKGAMLAGATAREAVQLAIDNTTHSGGEIQVEDIAAVLAEPVEAAAE